MSNRSNLASSEILSPDATGNPGLGEDRYRALIEATGQAVWSFTTGGQPKETECARVWWAELTGQSVVDQQRENAWLEVVHPDDRVAAAEAWKAALLAGITYDITYRVRSKVGGWRHVRARGCPILEKDGSIREWVGTLDDVTVQCAASAESKKLYAEVDAEKRRLEEVFQHAPSLIAVLRGPTHVFERINDRYSQFIGGRTVLGLPAREAFPEVIGQMHSLETRVLQKFLESTLSILRAVKSLAS